MTEATPTPGSISVQAIWEAKREVLELELLNEGVSLERAASDPDINSPGLALAGHMARVAQGRMWIFGETEMTYVSSLSDDDARDRLDVLFSFDVPAVFVSKGQEVQDYFVATPAGRRRP